MQSSIRFAASLVLLSSAFATYHGSTKLRRDGVLNLYPFPRVGRASRNTWQVPPYNLFMGNGLDYEPLLKRQHQMMAYPRVGRADAAVSLLRSQDLQGDLEFKQAPVKRIADRPGMWFGPRLGRSFKTDDDDITIVNENNDRSEPELMEPLQQDREKREANFI